jgi:hypothetical protein
MSKGAFLMKAKHQHPNHHLLLHILNFNYALQIGCRLRLDSGYQPPRALGVMLFRHYTKLPTERIEIKSLVVKQVLDMCVESHLC